MGMKSNSNHFSGTNGSRKGLLFKLDIQLFASKALPKKGQKLVDKATDIKLKNTIKELYHPGSKIGDGSTAAAIKHELKTGKLVGGKSHITKGMERLKNLERILNNKNLNKKDHKIAQKLYNDLKKALGGK